MSRIKRKENFTERWPRKKIKNNIYRLLAAGFFCYLVSLVFFSQFSKTNRIGIPQGAYATFYVHGEEAIATILFLAFIGSVCLIVALVFYFKLQYLIRTNKIEKDEPIPPKFVICKNCKEIFEGYVINGDVCPKCNGKIITTNEYRSNNVIKSSSMYKWNKSWLIFIFICFSLIGLLLLNQFLLYIKIDKCREKGGRYNLELDKCYEYRQSFHDRLK